MSWNDLVQNNLLGSKFVSKAAIVGTNGVVWGKSDGFQLSDQEAVNAANAFSGKDSVQAGGLVLEGEKYFVLNADEDRIIGKKQSKGFFIYKTPQTVIISLYNEGIQPEQCSKVTGDLADYFKRTGY